MSMAAALLALAAAGPVSLGPVSFGPVSLVSVATGQVEPFLAETLAAGGGAECLRTPLSLALMTESYVLEDAARPVPAALPCYDPARLAADLAAGRAVAFLGDAPAPGLRRILAVYPDGRAYAWAQPDPHSRKAE
ncbi:DUF6446 family protein [Phaeovulum vinaykumarii]|uniref:Histidine kinase n=1 Tax=Phaeovulum vinaykumarii TaxID=407234 RepID=A0A1N7JJK5_9RHOB|nr:DUF6446 family protein [Phaeovulum vinaykumarii]SIS49507.1 hypothetical protein SAMN05421795_10161 [Phaeovulum vinaykumarii]SOB89738.1 hypothetical protein SAMN05878426_10161 [Phaeovulum vinaykumarii]